MFRDYTYCRHYAVRNVKYIRTDNGKYLLMFRNYTYSRQYSASTGVRWKCSRQSSKKCNAFLLIGEGDVILRQCEEHTHKPWKYHCNSDGTYTKI
ncbi:unnamed protein product [Parnassius mnemosyne]|uniref:FLYWCH-type domain-containing protein n=1 Tax=Parnassius mnemosyne TaxID=213953 RepID=A0AAV1KAK4_9NEOP